MTVRFLHITDTHISADPNFALYGHRPAAHLRALIDIINDLPFALSFVLHTGDVVNDEKAESYAEAKKLLAKLKIPIHYVSGNHDDARLLQGMIGIEQPKERYDYGFVENGVDFVVLDSRGLVEPGGHLTDAQLNRLSDTCQMKSDQPLVIVLHHLPLPSDVPWLDEVHTMPSAMILDNYARFLDTIRPARDRIRGVFFGHIHRGIQIMQDGILFSSAPSTFGQLKTYPGQEMPIPAPEEAPGYCLVTIEERRTLIQQYTFAAPTDDS